MSIFKGPSRHLSRVVFTEISQGNTELGFLTVYSHDSLVNGKVWMISGSLPNTAVWDSFISGKRIMMKTFLSVWLAPALFWHVRRATVILVQSFITSTWTEAWELSSRPSPCSEVVPCAQCTGEIYTYLTVIWAGDSLLTFCPMHHTALLARVATHLPVQFQPGLWLAPPGGPPASVGARSTAGRRWHQAGTRAPNTSAVCRSWDRVWSWGLRLTERPHSQKLCHWLAG